MSIISKTIVNLEIILGKELFIPEYQRPYKWTEKNVSQLIEDIIKYQNKSAYRIGTIVLHKDKNVLNIVDGQQRLLTLTLLFQCLELTSELKLLNNPFSNDVSIKNLRKNYAFILQKIRLLSKDDKFVIRQFLLEKCEMVVVILDDISEAFQFFDSQNSRGKELEPFDLLKAYHLREMREVSEEERIRCVEKWELEVSDGDLKRVMNDYLFRIRKWVRHHQGREFTKDEIDVFKGITLSNVENYSYLQSQKIINGFIKKYDSDITREIDMQKILYPFQIDQVILNGKLFFEYIEYYIKMHKKLIINNVNTSNPTLDLLNNYDLSARKRTGDKYTRNLFDCGLMYYYDKFGEFRLKEFSELNFTWSYKMRLEQVSVQLATMDNRAIKFNSIFHSINNAITPYEVVNRSYSCIEKNKVIATKMDEIKEKFNSLGCIHE